MGGIERIFQNPGGREGVAPGAPGACVGKSQAAGSQAHGVLLCFFPSHSRTKCRSCSTLTMFTLSRRSSRTAMSTSPRETHLHTYPLTLTPKQVGRAFGAKRMCWVWGRLTCWNLGRAVGTVEGLLFLSWVLRRKYFGEARAR